MMPITAEYDHEARATYVHLKQEPTSRSVEINDDVVIDLASDSTTVGVEFLAPPVSREQIAALATRFGFAEHLREVWSAIQQAQPVEPRRNGPTVVYALEYPIGTGALAVASSRLGLDVEEVHEFAPA